MGKAAGLVKDSVALIRALIAASPVAGFDETTLRSGPAGEKKYVHGAFTELYSAFHPGTRSIESMKAGGILAFFAGSLSNHLCELGQLLSFCYISVNSFLRLG
jgi:hypothetical protein